MTTREKHAYMDMLPETARKHLMEALRAMGATRPPQIGQSYDPELLYVECQVCGKPVLWEQGKTTELLLSAGVDISALDERCMILSEGCPACSPGERDGYTLAVVRIAGLTPEEAAYMARPGGTA
ncbi:hypothetical protein LJC59_06095 [Desulfovibrio sp. OttesenSCG-928-A18]|nr:hypothetical protein [Desulfovibrio sp. OttesenSCG-928-A18]